jgi:hypothetical protein
MPAPNKLTGKWPLIAKVEPKTAKKANKRRRGKSQGDVQREDCHENAGLHYSWLHASLFRNSKSGGVEFGSHEPRKTINFGANKEKA